MTRILRGAVSGAEGCMFLAMIVFALLLIGLLVVAFFRFQSPPQGGGDMPAAQGRVRAGSPAYAILGGHSPTSTRDG